VTTAARSVEHAPMRPGVGRPVLVGPGRHLSPHLAEQHPPVCVAASSSRP
jgi:hypothetical protein